MSAQDLEFQVDLPDSEHEYEDTLDVIKLPLKIPEEELSDAPQFLFIRPDEYALFKCFWNTKKVDSNRKSRHFQILVSVEVHSVLLSSGFV